MVPASLYVRFAGRCDRLHHSIWHLRPGSADQRSGGPNAGFGEHKYAFRYRHQQHVAGPLPVRCEKATGDFESPLSGNVRSAGRTGPAGHATAPDLATLCRSRREQQSDRRSACRVDADGVETELPTGRWPPDIHSTQAAARWRLGRDPRRCHRTETKRAIVGREGRRTRGDERPLRRRAQHHVPGALHVRCRAEGCGFECAVWRHLSSRPRSDKAGNYARANPRISLRKGHQFRGRGGRCLSHAKFEE